MVPSAKNQVRPRTLAKIEACLAAAGKVFRERGFATASMDEVADLANVSKATLYSYYSSKVELFAAVVRAEGDRQSAALHKIRLDGDRPRLSLLRLGNAVLDLLLAEQTITSYRMVMAEASRAPELGRLYYQNGAARLHAVLEQFLAAAMQAGYLRHGTAHAAAAQFIGLVRADLMLRALLGFGKPAGKRERQAVVRAGVASFWRAWGRDNH